MSGVRVAQEVDVFRVAGVADCVICRAVLDVGDRIVDRDDGMAHAACAGAK